MLAMVARLVRSRQQSSHSNATERERPHEVAGAVDVVGKMRLRIAASAMLAGVAIAQIARADVNEPRNFSVERFHLSADRNGLFDVDWAEHPGGEPIDAAVVLGFMDSPLVVARMDANNERTIVGALLGTRATVNVVGSLALQRELTLSVDLPLVMYQGRASLRQSPLSGLDSISSFGLGNLRFTPRYTVLTEDGHGFGLAVLAATTVPTETAGDAYFGDHGISVAPTIALSKRSGEWRAGLNVGYFARQQARLINLIVDDEVFARAGVGYELQVDRPASVGVTLSAATSVAGDSMMHLELLVGSTVQLDPRLELFGAVGAGLAHGFGTPDARAMVGVRLAHGGRRARGADDEDRARDSDDDGVLDIADHCPHEAGVAALDGCPSSDDDGDGIAYDRDACTDAPEDVDGYRDDDGCPDLDNDDDGVLDDADRCPREAGPPANQGCPAPAAPPEPAVESLPPATQPPATQPPATQP
jgi:hypothetical protein